MVRADNYKFNTQPNYDRYCEYEVKFFSFGDADATLIKYRVPGERKENIILVDAGFPQSGNEIIQQLNDWGVSSIDYAFCTHPHQDHKGGFFTILNTKDIYIQRMYFLDPAIIYQENANSKKEIEESTNEDVVKARSCYNNPNDEKENLINLAIQKCKKVYHFPLGSSIPEINIEQVGPSNDYLNAAFNELTNNGFNDVTDAKGTEKYDKQIKIEYEDATNALDQVEDDTDAANKCSMMLLFSPKGDDRKFLFLGDATMASLESVKLPSGCYVKIPHHGSPKNLSKKIINDLSPKRSYIFAKGYDNHPNKNVVVALAKYGDVYSTHVESFSAIDKSHRQHITNFAEPLMKKLGTE